MTPPETLRYEAAGGVGTITVDHPPINLLDRSMIRDLAEVIASVASDPTVRVLVLDSANPEFFIAHADVGQILAMPRERHPAGERLNFFHRLVESIRSLPQLSIAVIAGRARGGGSEIALSMDLRFAAIGHGVLGQPEVALGIIPGGSGTQRIPRLVGRGRALEMILGCGDVDALTAERWGLVNRALPLDELRPYVSNLATRVAGFPPEAVRAAKEAVDAAAGDQTAGLLREADLFNRAWATGPGEALIRRFLDLGGQQRDTELDLPTILDRLSRER